MHAVQLRTKVRKHIGAIRNVHTLNLALENRISTHSHVPTPVHVRIYCTAFIDGNSFEIIKPRWDRSCHLLHLGSDTVAAM